jgi:hypothetical protein
MAKGAVGENARLRHCLVRSSRVGDEGRESRGVTCVGTASLLERSFARQAALGWIGKNNADHESGKSGLTMPAQCPILFDHSSVGDLGGTGLSRCSFR